MILLYIFYDIENSQDSRIQNIFYASYSQLGSG